MNEWILISSLIIAVLVVVILIIMVVMFKKKKGDKTEEFNYKVFFFLGIIWIPIGSVFMIAVNLVMGIAFMGIGLSYIAIGLANKDKWMKEE